MRRFLLILLAVVFLGGGISKAAPFPDQEMHNLKKQQKAQRKQIKEEQRASKRAMSQHPVTKEERTRMKKDLKMQRQLLKNSQKQAVRSLKQSRKPLKPHAAAAK
jgi:hypothetical protein